MRLESVYIDGFKNLKKASVSFDSSNLTTVIIGQNGAGKSNLIEAIVDVFRFVDLNRGAPRFKYEVVYQLDEKKIKLSNTEGKSLISCDGASVSRAAFDRDKASYFPDLVFGYYSGASRRLEALFDSHQRRYYDAIKLEKDVEKCRAALTERRLFYCRQIHGILALVSSFAFPSDVVNRLLREKLGVTGFHSALTVLREPWFAKGKKTMNAGNLWGARGPAGACAKEIRSLAFHPVALNDKPIDDYRDKGSNESQLGAFFRNLTVLEKMASKYDSDRDLFTALEAMDISDLIRDLHLWVKRVDNENGDVSFADLSDGERQLLMVMGLIRVSRGKRSLFLLDEPETHLNPHWQLSYLDLIQEWTDLTSDESSCHIVMSSHNPLTIASLEKEEVRVMSRNENGTINIAPPYISPRGMGFTSTLTEIFGLPTSLDPETQRDIDERNELAHLTKRKEDEERRLIELNDILNRQGFMFEDREPLYQDFLQSWKDIKYLDQPSLRPDQIESRRKAMAALISELLAQKKEGVE